MSIFSDMDWIILLGVGALILFGNGGTQAVRTLGRWYGRAIRMKRQMLAEVAEAADIPVPLEGQPTSLRSMILGEEPGLAAPVRNMAVAVAGPLGGFPGRSAPGATATATTGAAAEPPSITPIWTSSIAWDTEQWGQTR
jgi:Sec-independent protein translocase protein TatA